MKQSLRRDLYFSLIFTDIANICPGYEMEVMKWNRKTFPFSPVINIDGPNFRAERTL